MKSANHHPPRPLKRAGFLTSDRFADFKIDPASLPTVEDFAEARQQILREQKAKDRGVSLRDIARMVDDCDDAVPTVVNRWTSDRRFTAQAIGKCPLDGRASLYRLPAVLADIAKIENWSPRV